MPFCALLGNKEQNKEIFMIAVFPKIEEFYARREKKKLLTFYFIILALVLAIEIFFITYFIVTVNTTQDRSLKDLLVALSSVLLMLFGWFSIIFFTLKYRRTKKYVAMFDDFQTGIRETETGIFKGYDLKIREKAGVDFYTMKVMVKPKDRRFDDVCREILIYKQCPRIEIKEGDKIKMITHSNILIAFEVEEVNEKK